MSLLSKVLDATISPESKKTRTEENLDALTDKMFESVVKPLPQTAFRHLLCHERKRSERSRKNFLLGADVPCRTTAPIGYEIEAYDVWHRKRLLEAKPGITGLWQVHGRSRTTFDDMVRLDLRYSRTCSPASDLKILLQTPRAVFSGDGAY